MPERKRTKSVSEAALLLGISRSRLQQMRREASWWRDDLGWIDGTGEGDGIDVVGVALAQAEHHHHQELKKHQSTDEDARHQQRMNDLEYRAALENAEIKTLERRKRRRIEDREEKLTVGAETVVLFQREALAELRRLQDDLPWVFSRQVPAEFVHWCYTMEPEEAQRLDDLAPLQRAMLKIVESFDRWLNRGGDDDDEQAEVGPVGDDSDILSELFADEDHDGPDVMSGRNRGRDLFS